MVQAEGTGAERRARRWRSVAEKRGIVELTLVPGASVALVARAHGVNANQVFQWRRAFERGELSMALNLRFAVSYLHLVKGGTASSLDIGAMRTAHFLPSSDLGNFHVDANEFLNETEGPIRRGQWGQAVAISHPLTQKLGATAIGLVFEPRDGALGHVHLFGDGNLGLLII